MGVYRCGGTTLDVSIVDVRGGMYHVICSEHRKLGGDKFTALIANFLADEFQHKWKLDPRESRRSMSKLKAAAEDCKHILSTLNTAQCFVESLHEGVEIKSNVSRARLDILITQDLSKSGLALTDINKVVVCGGATKMPRLQKAVAAALPESEMLTSLTADEVVALGCCNQAAIMGEPWDATCDLRQVAIPVTSKSISVKCGDEDERQTMDVFSAKTPLSSRFSIQIPLGKKHHLAVVDVFEDTE